MPAPKEFEFRVRLWLSENYCDDHRLEFHDFLEENMELGSLFDGLVIAVDVESKSSTTASGTTYRDAPMVSPSLLNSKYAKKNPFVSNETHLDGAPEDV